MKNIVSNLVKYGIPILISVGLAWFLYNNVDIDAIKTSLRQDVNYWWFVPVIVVSIFSHIFRALRWRLQLRAINIDAPLWVLVNSIFGHTGPDGCCRACRRRWLRTCGCR